MRRDEAAGRLARPDLPAGDVPSAEVLDELLRAFAADGTDERTLERIDLTSPEVEELISGSSPGNPRQAPEVEVETESDEHAEPEVDGEVQVEAELAAGTAPEASAAVVDTSGPADEADEVRHDPGPDDESSDREPDEPADETTATDMTDTTQGSRTIVIDGSDDPPDAVYLAAGDPLLAASAGGRGLAGSKVSLAPDASKSDAPVFIDDAAIAQGETISLVDATSATRIEPRLRERRIAVKRAAGRKRLRWVLVAVGVLAVVVAALAVLGSSLFAIDEVRVDGAERTDEAALQAVVEELEGTPVLRADTDRAEEQLKAIPWVASARVTTQFPDGATIEIRERTPIAAYQGPDGRFRVIDIDGRVLEVLETQPIEYLPVTSPEAPDLDPGRFAPQGFIAAANLVQALTPELRAIVESVSVTGNASDLRMAISEGREVRFGAGRDLVAKLVRLQTRLELVDAGGFQYIDVSTNEVTTG